MVKETGRASIIDRAIEVSARAHQGQFRKGTDIPYIIHPYSVGMLLLKDGCTDQIVAAGLLHDTIEDTPLTLEEIRSEFGEDVARIVSGCSEPDRSLPWEERKAHTLSYIRTAPLDIRLVTCADKLHNIRTIITDLERLGEQVWTKFHQGRQKQEWYYRGLVQNLWPDSHHPSPGSLFQQLKEEVELLFGVIIFKHFGHCP